MDQKDIAYKRGAWRMGSADKPILDKNKLLLSIIEKVKMDIENNDPSDKVAQKHINDLLYHYCWKMIHAEKDKEPT